MEETPSLSQGNVEYLLQCARYNDFLMQTYRTFMLTLESVFLGLGTGLCVAVIAIDDLAVAIALAVMLVALGALGLWVVAALHKVIVARGLDVYHWHCALIKEEQKFPSKVRFYTRFKIYQRQRRSGERLENDEVLLDSTLTKDEIRALIEDPPGETRRVIDRWLPLGIAGTWVIVLATGVGWVAFGCVEAVI